MVVRVAKPSPPRPPVPAVEADERYHAEVETFIARNRDDLDGSIRRSREELGRGVQAGRTIDEIIADGRKRHGGAA